MKRFVFATITSILLSATCVFSVSGVQAQSPDEPIDSSRYEASQAPRIQSPKNVPGQPPAQPLGNLNLVVEKSDVPVGKGSGLWNWTPVAKYHDSIVEVSTSGGSGTGVLIKADKSKRVKDGYEGLVLTAWHVIQDDIVDGKIKVTYRNKRRAKGCQVVQFDEATDVAILWVWVPGDIEPAKLAQESVQRGDRLELVGLGGGTNLLSCVRAFEASASPPSSPEKIFADVPLLPGDSGGPVFNQNHEVVGIISGGWFWWDSGLKTASGAYIRTTWPARASNIGPIRSMMAKMDAKKVVADAGTKTLNR